MEIINYKNAIDSTLSADYIERHWRDSELTLTDWIVPVIDHPKHAAYLVYRQELRDYPQQADFPNGERPVKP
jgi:hypothetical protein